MALRRVVGRGLYSPGQTQWQPTLTEHDPNPPITLEDGVVITTAFAPTDLPLLDELEDSADGYFLDEPGLPGVAAPAAPAIWISEPEPLFEDEEELFATDVVVAQLLSSYVAEADVAFEDEIEEAQIADITIAQLSSSYVAEADVAEEDEAYETPPSDITVAQLNGFAPAPEAAYEEKEEEEVETQFAEVVPPAIYVWVASDMPADEEAEVHEALDVSDVPTPAITSWVGEDDLADTDVEHFDPSESASSIEPVAVLAVPYVSEDTGADEEELEFEFTYDEAVVPEPPAPPPPPPPPPGPTPTFGMPRPGGGGTGVWITSTATRPGKTWRKLKPEEEWLAGLDSREWEDDGEAVEAEETTSSFSSPFTALFAKSDLPLFERFTHLFKKRPKK